MSKLEIRYQIPLWNENPSVSADLHLSEHFGNSSVVQGSISVVFVQPGSIGEIGALNRNFEVVSSTQVELQTVQLLHEV